MKRTLTINLNQRVYNIDEDAYNMLAEYMASLRSVFGQKPESSEIIDDIECRIGELCDEHLANGRQVITIDDITDVISRMGRPEEFKQDDDSADVRSCGTQSCGDPFTVAPAQITRRFYRDPRNKMVGGVCAGAAAYLGVDVLWVRLAVILLFVCFNVATLVAYMLVWTIVPEANTPASRLEMTGTTPTMENIGRSVAEGYNQVREAVTSPESKSAFVKLGNALVKVAAVAFKVLLVLIAVFVLPPLVVSVAGFLLSAFGIVSDCIGVFGQFAGLFRPFTYYGGTLIEGMLSVMGMCLVVGIPIFALLRCILSSVFSSIKPMGRGTGWTLFVMWFLGLVLVAIMFFLTGRVVDLFHLPF